ncbi:glutamate-cysteine ligase family protein [Massilia sp. GER05]|uniref:glutamate-cysteine ligase family protein n=1 Tax=Massilia sp. GER05 TaxID=3394605 RepID=UPI003F83DB7E
MAGSIPPPRFAAARPGSMRIGLEWMVLDRETYDLHPAAPDIAFRLEGQDAAWAATPDIDATTLDVATSALDGYCAAADALEDMRCRVRRAARSVGAAVAGGGTHPVRTGGRQRNHGAGFGMHVRIGAPSADEAVRIGAWLNQRAPLFIALSASSPYWRGHDSGFCSARNNVAGTFQGSGIMPPALRSWQDVVQHVARLARYGLATRVEDVDWDVRPDPANGAVELRALDAPLRPAYAAALACYARELCVEVAERPGSWPGRRAADVYPWNRLNATRRGVLGAWIDPCTRKKHSIAHVVRDDLARLAARSDDPDFPAACVLIDELLHNGGQARWLTAHMAAGARPADLARLASTMFDSPVVPGWKVER